MAKPYIRMTFETKDGKDLVLNVPNASATVDASTVSDSMSKIKLANAIDGVGMIMNPKSASIFTTVSKSFVVQ